MKLDTDVQNCGNCAYWDDLSEHDVDLCRCLAATHHSTYSPEPIFEGKPGSKISVADGSEYFAALHTPATHVCAEWVAIEPIGETQP